MRGIVSVLILLNLLVVPSHAGTPDQAGRRLLFRAAEEALVREETAVFKLLLTQLEDYPLYPYLVYQELTSRLETASIMEIAAFLQSHADTPLADQLRRRWLEHLARTARWQDFAKYYRPFSGDTVMRCYNAQALWHIGASKEAMAASRVLWLSGRSQPDECDAVFSRWRRAGGMTSQLLWERTFLALQSGQTGLVRYLRSLHAPAERRQLDTWQALLDRPENITTVNWGKATHVMAPRMLPLIFSRLIRQDVQQALAAWSYLLQQGLDRDKYAAVEQEIALYLVLRREGNALAHLESLPAVLQTSQLREWRLRAALHGMEWPAVLRAFEALETHQQDLPRWRYWRARALEALGNPDPARRLYTELAQGSSFYGLLAADRIGASYAIDVATDVMDWDTHAIEIRPAAQRIYELLQLERIVPARREWAVLTQGLDPQELAAAAVLAYRWQWYDRAIFAAAETQTPAKLQQIRFPTPHRSLVLYYAEHHQLNPSLVFAIMRQESAFMTDARSASGALGLMQILPATGRTIAHRLNERFSSPWQLLDPDRNVRFGTYYLRLRLNQLDDNLVLATAAYNAGAARVQSWRPLQDPVDSDIWIETLPFFETRDYIQRVFTYVAIYSRQLQQAPLVISTLMPPVLPHPAMTASAQGH